MAKLAITFVTRRKWSAVALAISVALSVLVILIGISMLPGMLFGTTLTTAVAEESIRRHLLSRAIVSFHERSKGEKPDTLHGGYQAQVLESLNAVEFITVNVDTVVFSAFKISRGFVAEVVIRGKDGTHLTRYYCFAGTYLTGECSKWNWLLAW
ncbi:MAG: hypothetical protein ACXW4Z_17990 [Candidatus Binatia bacterium]